ncbi:efflux RND transporter periplasmic adaptor subunit [Frigoriflavimonas asaccharolytica]|uniref:Cobalt-zinc-cadmium efflux system membrane fusion protein n=1 Tax=Frigoriflavimonas asaccharolytica TaxID=2735899 RepID=A0A8J8K7D9_9FLAO|nr:efflux RND transporter periplasmic adaptor subunit [Frigoriflavimonas asaccharolytica]NRS91893.1 cobalt-zinc-cadmium efflux system membrane fusion protein [Frigoriflavimonas asaccharolytica]
MKTKYIKILVALLILNSCSEEKTTEKEVFAVVENQVSLTDLQIKNAAIETNFLNKLDIANKILVNGQIDVPPQGMASVSAPSGGYVKVSKFMPGNFVQKGQTLAILENPELVQLQQDYMLAKSNLQYAQQDFSRQKDLNANKASSDKVTQKAFNENKNQNIIMKSTAQNLSAMGINPSSITPNNIRRTFAVVSPISGYISTVNVNIGQYVSPMDKMFDVVNTGDIHLALKVFEKDLAKIKPGQKVFGFTNQDPSKKYEGRVFIIGKDFSADRSVLVHCHFVDENLGLLPGTFMNAEIESDSENGIVIPEDAIVTWEEKQYIFEEVKPKTYKMFPVQIGNSENGNVEILNFKPEFKSKKFVTKGAYQLLMALKNVEE